MPYTQALKFQKTVTLVGLILFIAKLIAWQITNSVAVLTDALESIVNVVAGFMGWYALYIANKPRDANHPYGHGKIEFVTAGIEGCLVVISGIAIIYEAIISFKNPHAIKGLDIGLVIISFTAFINYILGALAIKKGNASNSIALISGGKHLQTDTYSTLGIIIGLVILKISNWLWLDSFIAILFALLIIVTGYKIIREALAGIMDEADEKLLEEVINVIEKNRNNNWIDIHNLRIIKYGAILHLDCHLTLPWYINIKEGHNEVDALDKLIRNNFGNSVELFVHSDGCQDFSCKICTVSNCPQRQYAFTNRITWQVSNVLQNKKQGA